MTETTETEATPEPQASEPKPKMIRRVEPAAFKDILHTTTIFVQPAAQALGEALQLHLQENPGDDHRNAISHYDVIKKWCQENPVAAASIVLGAIYLTSSGCSVQSHYPEPPADQPAEPTPAESPPESVAVYGPADGQAAS